ncbi:MAG: gliding motility-associated C-terminal domain-containing protein, partial [Bacteroidetes bacterium]|nr:gliding motility-associated C-terminal domain-containing protein [Bacteroidota bacterium]
SLDKPGKLNPIFTANKQGANTLILNVTTPAGCAGSDTVTLTVFPAAFLFTSNDTAICSGESARIHVNAKGVKSFHWTPDVRIDNVYSLDPIVNPIANQKYRVYAVDTNFCSDTAEVMVRVHPRAMLQLPDSVRLYPGQSYQVEPGGNCSYYSWFPPLGVSDVKLSNPVLKPEVNTRYFVTGVTEAGCVINDSISVFVSNESIVDIPNAFTPGSGVNNKLKVVHLGDATLKKFVIYNRWGNPVFETNDINTGWDGTWKNEPQPMGVYVYTLEAVSPTGRVFNKQGNITLIR